VVTPAYRGSSSSSSRRPGHNPEELQLGPPGNPPSWTPAKSPKQLEVPMHGWRDRQPTSGERGDVVLERSQVLFPSGVHQGWLHPATQLPPVLGFRLDDPVEQRAKSLDLRTHEVRRNNVQRRIRLRMITRPRSISRAPVRAAWTGVEATLSVRLLRQSRLDVQRHQGRRDHAHTPTTYSSPVRRRGFARPVTASGVGARRRSAHRTVDSENSSVQPPETDVVQPRS